MPRKRKRTTPAEPLIAGRLRALREVQGLTQQELAERLGIQQALISEYERGRVRVHGALLIDFARALKVSADEILGLTPPKPQPRQARNGRLTRRIERIHDLPAGDQKAVLKFLDALVERQDRRQTRA